MRPKHRNRRIGIIAISALVAGVGAFLLLQALGDNKQLFKNPSDVVALTFIQGVNDIRVGGLVVDASVQKIGGLVTTFSVVNFENVDESVTPLKVHYVGVLPDLFREGQGVVMTGRYSPDGVFIASNVLAKHDENYMPKMPDS
ncbi:MAG: cytochrome c maturation protein CcmE [Robiginitomaculum sp.]